MSAAPTPDDGPGAATSAPAADPTPDGGRPDPGGRVRGALLRYRVLAWITGIWLLLLTAEMVWKYLLGQDLPSWGQLIPIVHGWVYLVYLLMTLDLAIKVRWPWKTTVLTLIAGTIPFLSFWFEHVRTREVRTAYRI